MGINKIIIDHTATAILFFPFLKVIISELVIKITNKEIKTITNVGLKSFII